VSDRTPFEGQVCLEGILCTSSEQDEVFVKVHGRPARVPAGAWEWAWYYLRSKTSTVWFAARIAGFLAKIDLARVFIAEASGFRLVLSNSIAYLDSVCARSGWFGPRLFSMIAKALR
jgi:hypothetical protein